MDRNLTQTAPKRRSYETRVPAADRALDLLELLAISSEGMTLSDVSRKLRIPRSSAHYLIECLAWRGYLRRTSGGRAYVLSTHIGKLGESQLANSQLKEICLPHLQCLVKTLGFSAQVGVLDGAEALVIQKVDPPSGKRLDSWVGRHFDLHCTALGKALLAYLSDEELEKLFKENDLSSHNPNTICSLGKLKEHLAAIRVRGYAVDDQEHELGVRCVAAPILSEQERALAAVTVFSPVSQFASWQIPHCGLKVASAAREISRSLLLPG